MLPKLTSIEVTNFKCFRHQPIELSHLTVLAGLNGMGKSSVIQALLLLRQSFPQRSRRNSLRLSGELIDLGTGSDILFDLADEDEITLALEYDGHHRVEYRFLYDRDREVLRTHPERPSGVPRRLVLSDSRRGWLEVSSSSDVRRPLSSALFSDSRFQYLAAERLGPRKMLPWSEEEVSKRSLGAQGEHVLAFLARHGSESLPDGDPRINKSEVKQTVEAQVTAWLQDTSPGSILEIAPLRDIDAVSGRFSVRRKGDVASPSFRSTHVGFGLSYVLPVLTALIAARRDDLIIIENPEAHLHPRGQTRLGELASRAAAAGAQVIVETHSDHFLDGIRWEVQEKRISPEDIRLHYFTRHGAEAAVISPVVNPDGTLSDWPKGFFDERDENLIRLLAGS